eukprot:3366139-Amphidinium_carterae.2
MQAVGLYGIVPPMVSRIRKVRTIPSESRNLLCPAGYYCKLNSGESGGSGRKASSLPCISAYWSHESFNFIGKGLFMIDKSCLLQRGPQRSTSEVPLTTSGCAGTCMSNDVPRALRSRSHGHSVIAINSWFKSATELQNIPSTSGARMKVTQLYNVQSGWVSGTGIPDASGVKYDNHVVLPNEDTGAMCRQCPEVIPEYVHAFPAQQIPPLQLGSRMGYCEGASLVILTMSVPKDMEPEPAEDAETRSRACGDTTTLS